MQNQRLSRPQIACPAHRFLGGVFEEAFFLAILPLVIDSHSDINGQRLRNQAQRGGSSACRI